MIFGPYNLNLSPRLIIKDIQLDIDTLIHHFWGKNGVGKSTLLNQILIQCQKENRKFAYINQNYRQNWLWWYTLVENLELAVFGKLPIIKPKSWQDYDCIKLPQVQSEISWLGPLLEGSQKQVEFNKESEISTIDLSGGQLQRVILFRELLRKPDILLLDEAFSALDKNATAELTAWLLSWQLKYPFQMISISHDLDVLKMLSGSVWELSLTLENILKVDRNDDYFNEKTLSKI